jgi:predicted RNase H-like nuclease (RuvC/YqgF family)
MTDTLRLFQNEVHSLLYKFDSLQKEIIELSHLESRLIPKFDNRYMRREEARPIMREAIIEHLDMQLDRMNKKASTLGAVVQVVQILFPFVVAFGILVN